MRRFWRNNGLSVTLLVLFVVSLVGQAVAGYRNHANEQHAHDQPAGTFVSYLASPAFLEVTMENWESEFLQMGAYVILTVFLYQRGSAESKDPDEPEEGGTPGPTPERAPWPVRAGGLALALYRHSLSLAFLALFLAAFVLHAVGGAGEYNAEQAQHGQPERVTVLGYLGTSRFWFESLQNWQSEFLAIAAMVLLTIWLREKGSPESKPVEAPHGQTGTD